MMIQWQQTEENGEWDTAIIIIICCTIPAIQYVNHVFKLPYRAECVDDILFMFDVLDPVFIKYRLFDADAEGSRVLLKYYCRTEAGLVPAIRARAGPV